MPTNKRRVMRAALIALAAGGLVALANPMPSAAHDAAIALASAARLTAGAVDFAGAHLSASAARLA